MLLDPRSAIVLLIVACLFVPFPCAAQPVDRFQLSTPPTLVERLDAARVLRQVGRYAESAVALRKILEQAPSYYRAQYNLALLYAFQGKNDDAIAAFDKALVIKEREGIHDASLDNSIGWFYLLRGDFATAERHLQSALAELEVDEGVSDSTRSKIYNNLGTLYLYMGELDRASDYLETAKSKFGSELATRNLDMLRDLRLRVERKEN